MDYGSFFRYRFDQRQGFMKIDVDIPDELAQAFGSGLERHVVEALVIEGYRSGRLSQRQAGRMLGMDYWQSEAFLQSRRVPLNYDGQELASDGKDGQWLMNDR